MPQEPTVWLVLAQNAALIITALSSFFAAWRSGRAEKAGKDAHEESAKNTKALEVQKAATDETKDSVHVIKGLLLGGMKGGGDSHSFEDQMTAIRDAEGSDLMKAVQAIVLKSTQEKSRENAKRIQELEFEVSLLKSKVPPSPAPSPDEPKPAQPDC